MQRLLHISDSLSLPQEAVTQTFAILGIRGSGLAVWEPKLRAGARRILRFLVERSGEPVPTQELLEGSNMAKSGTFTTYLSDLRTARLIVTDRGTVAANKETLFL